MLKSMIAAIVMIFAPLAASAVTVAPNGSALVSIGDVIDGQFLESQGFASPVTFTVEATEAMSLRAGSATMLRIGSWTDPVLKFGKTGSEVIVTGSDANGNRGFSLPTIILAAGETATVIFEFTGLGAGTGGQVSFLTAAVPLPAAGWMLISALAGMGFLARRRAAA